MKNIINLIFKSKNYSKRLNKKRQILQVLFQETFPSFIIISKQEINKLLFEYNRLMHNFSKLQLNWNPFKINKN